MYGGGGYEAGATQFGGGGFMNSQPENDFKSPGPKQAGKKLDGVKSCTIKQLKEACEKHTRHQEDIGSHQNVTIVAKIQSVKDASSGAMMKMVVYDGTGSFNVEHYMPQDDEQAMQRMSEWREGVYVRLYGNMTEFEGNFRLLAYIVRKVTDFNEVTYHNLQAIFQHAHHAKGGSGTGLLANGDAAGGAPAAAGPANPAFGNDVGNDGLTHPQRQVKAVMDSERHQTNPDGLTVEQIMSEVPGLQHQAVQSALNVLQENGHVYTASDEYHYRSTIY
ncbi:g10320 [Coccomyxa viridis]|uniref:G10320 protein n=1 Tax=Coccomyxa viridis TaxID=1274662 RepID=A0ABP1G7S9_9CHLO